MRKERTLEFLSFVAYWLPMSDQSPPATASRPLLLLAGDADRVFAWRHGQPVAAGRFLAEARRLAQSLPDSGHVLNLCEDRYRFLVGFCAALIRGLPTLLPPNRAPEAVRELTLRYEATCAIADADSIWCDLLQALPVSCHLLPSELPVGEAVHSIPMIAPDTLAAIGFTSGSTGTPKPQNKHWGSFCASSVLNAEQIFRCLSEHAGHDVISANLLATVPAQHMWGMETSVLLPLLTGCAIHAGRPFFPADIASALAEMPAPRVLVTTPVHLKALIGSGQTLPPVALILSAAAPLSVELAQQAEQTTGARVLELFGSTETCVIAHRRTALDANWSAYRGVRLESGVDGTVVSAAWFAQSVTLQDHIEQLDAGRFRLAGRLSDHLEIAGKRASLAELTGRLLALDGVNDAVLFQLDAGAGAIQRLAGLVVSSGRDEVSIIGELRDLIDPVFLPRPLRRVDALPRNAAGKLPRQALLDALQLTSVATDG